MSKPLGVALGWSSTGPTMRVTPINRCADKIWEAVDEAVLAGWTPRQFKTEVIEAWAYRLKQDADATLEELQKE